jgi:hypothetical protein
MEEGGDIAALQPHLMAHMGHSSFRETDYYIHASARISELAAQAMADAAGGVWDIPEGGDHADR